MNMQLHFKIVSLFWLYKHSYKTKWKFKRLNRPLLYTLHDPLSSIVYLEDLVLPPWFTRRGFSVHRGAQTLRFAADTVRAFGDHGVPADLVPRTGRMQDPLRGGRDTKWRLWRWQWQLPQGGSYTFSIVSFIGRQIPHLEILVSSSWELAYSDRLGVFCKFLCIS